MSGFQLVVFPYLVLVLPGVGVLAWYLKRRYTAAIVRLQQSSGSLHLHPAPPGAFGSPPSPRSTAAPALSLHVLSAREALSHGSRTPAVAAADRLRRRVLAVQFAGSLLYWCAVLGLLAAAMAGRDAMGALLLIGPALLPFLLVPPGVAWALQAGAQRAVVNIATAAILLSGLGFALSEGRWESELGFSFGYAAIAAMVSAFMRPSVRGAGLPLVIASMVSWIVLVGLFGLALALEKVIGESLTPTGDVALGVGELLLIAGATSWCGWRTIVHLSSRYSAKRFSDGELGFAAYWILLTAFVVGSVVKEQFILSPGSWRPEYVCAAIVLLWLLWRWLDAAALRRVVRGTASSVGPLLLLRVFKPSNRSEAFMDRFFAQWRFAGPVWMIAGPDLAGAYLEPTEFFAYLRGRLRERVVAAVTEASARIEALDSGRDPDGRFRVNEVLCTNATWQATVVEMIDRASVILLDLREYSQQRRGTRFELAELLRRAALAKVLLLIDAKDDAARLSDEIQSIWREVRGTRSMETAGDLRILRIERSSPAEIRGIFRAAATAALDGA